MSILDSLKSIINVDLSGIKGINLSLFSNNKKVQITNKILIIDPTKYNQTQQKRLGRAIKSYVSDEDGLVIEDNTNKLISDFKIVDQEKENQEILFYFQDKIPSSDLAILRAAIYLKTVHDRGNNPALASKLKSDIVLRWGQRGANIANLYTAGYFLSVIKPLYEELSNKEGYVKTMFDSRYETIVMQYPFAVFVNRMMTEKDLREIIESKILINKKYGIKRLNIHAIGRENINKIQNVLVLLKTWFTQAPEIDSGKDYINVTIWF